MKKYSVLFYLFLFFVTHIQAQVSNPYKIDFETHSPGPYTTSMAQQDFPGASWYHGFEYDRATIIEDNNNKVLRVKYPQGCLGPNYGEGCAVQVKWNLPEPAKTMWVSYKIKIEEGFDFRKGGKLPGLCGGKAYSGGNKPASKGDGWSARIMWRQDGSIHQYMYYVEQVGNYGDYWAWQDELSTPSRFIPGKWHTVTTQIILNTVQPGTTTGNHDGALRSWLDGKMILEKTNLRLVDFEDQMIDIFYISTFHGGDDSSWSPLNDSYICYDDIIVSKDSIEANPEPDPTPDPDPIEPDPEDPDPIDPEPGLSSLPLQITFEGREAGTYTSAMAKADFPAGNQVNDDWYYGFDQGRAEIVKEGTNEVLRVKYPANCKVPDNDLLGCGIQVKWKIPEVSNTIWMSYRIKFEEGFNLSEGGKLPGLCGGKAYLTGGYPARNGDGWSSRLAWKSDAGVRQYMYWVEQSAYYGNYWEWRGDPYNSLYKFEPGRWHTVTTQIVLNTINNGSTEGNHDGIIRCWLDGKKAIERTGLRLIDQTDALPGIDMFYFSTFHGGDDISTLRRTEGFVRFDDIIISKNPINVAPQLSSTGNSSIKEEDFIVYVTADMLNIQSQKELRSASIYSPMGKLMMKAYENNFSIANLGNGVYFVSVQFNDGSIAKAKFIK